MDRQYERRDTIEINGIPITVSDDQSGDEVIDIFKEAKVSVHRKPLGEDRHKALHRLKYKQPTIVKVVNRKFAKGALICGYIISLLLMWHHAKLNG